MRDDEYTCALPLDLQMMGVTDNGLQLCVWEATSLVMPARRASACAFETIESRRMEPYYNLVVCVLSMPSDGGLRACTGKFATWQQPPSGSTYVTMSFHVTTDLLESSSDGTDVVSDAASAAHLSRQDCKLRGVFGTLSRHK